MGVGRGPGTGCRVYTRPEDPMTPPGTPGRAREKPLMQKRGKSVIFIMLTPERRVPI